MGHGFLERMDRAARHAELVELGDDTVAIRKGCEPVFDYLLQRLVVAHPAAVRLEPIVLREFRPSPRPGPTGKFMVLAAQRDVPARTLEAARRTAGGMLRAVARRRKLFLANRDQRHGEFVH